MPVHNSADAIFGEQEMLEEIAQDIFALGGAIEERHIRLRRIRPNSTQFDVGANVVVCSVVPYSVR